ncbi:MAG: AbrB family transcriptional regulator [Rhizobiaceae bacterium]|nr:AbrB family transcriptional regulator [Rhizobiaceae bacterium]
MTNPDSSSRNPPLARLPRGVQWLLLIVLSIILAGALEVAHLPAALLIGPMVAGIVIGTNGGTLRVPKAGFAFGQALVGVLIASSVSLELLSSFFAEWPLFLAVVIATLSASSSLGFLISRWRVLPGTTGVWGSAPGAASAMVIMADAFGADARLVAFMQYLRVILVSLTAAVIASLWVDTSGVEVAPIIWFPPFHALSFAMTIVVALVGCVAGKLLRMPAPCFMGSFIIAAFLHLGADVAFQLPNWLLAVAYAVVGWSIGLNFTRPILVHAARALPQIIAAIVILIGFCGLLAWMLVETLGVDPLSAYLATSPGGMDSIAIIAAASRNVDISFVMAMQLVRFIVVLLFGPAISRLVARFVHE